MTEWRCSRFAGAEITPRPSPQSSRFVKVGVIIEATGHEAEPLVSKRLG